MYSEIIRNGKVLWDYMSKFREEEKSDIIIVCCSYDLRVCDYACNIFKRTNAKKIIFTGYKGNWTRDLWVKSEADIFKDRAICNGINSDFIFIEDKATNLGENISFTKKYITGNETVTFISKQNTLLRLKLTITKHINNKFYVSSPDFDFPNDVSYIVGLYGLLNEMVGDIERVIKYPKLGYQEKHNLPLKILESYNFLKENGYIEHLC